ncbi:MAG: hypothetical protein KJ950_10720 [Proteobacteria bacterium]|nr:hypothetical protein [Pseudomonadota bacterium]MBU1687463.1 hypothetical protein [Pseudomonadota bacterium]
MNVRDDDHHNACSCCRSGSEEHEVDCDCPLCQKMHTILKAFHQAVEKTTVQQQEDE